MPPSCSEVEKPEKAISENRPLTIGLIVAVVTLLFTCCAGLVSMGVATWKAGQWTEGIQTKLTLILARVEGTVADLGKLQGKTENLEDRVKRIELTGSPELMDLKKELNILREDFRIHEIRQGATKVTP